MSEAALSQSGYARAVRAMATPRSIEHRVFSRITGRLQSAGQDAADFPELAAALHENLSLWTAIMADVCDSRNALPEGLRAQLAYLAQFTRVHTRKVLRGQADAAPLIDINAAVMRGLRGSVAS